MTSITVREYHPESGALLGNISVLNFGKITSGTTSKVKVIDIAFSEVTEVSNIKLGLISSGGLVVNPNPEDVSDDGSASNGYFGIESSFDFDSNKSSSALTRHFAGINTTVTAEDTKNVLISSRSVAISYYIYLDIEIGAASVSGGNGAYKIFFDYV